MSSFIAAMTVRDSMKPNQDSKMPGGNRPLRSASCSRKLSGTTPSLMGTPHEIRAVERLIPSGPHFRAAIVASTDTRLSWVFQQHISSMHEALSCVSLCVTYFQSLENLEGSSTDN